MTVIADNRKYLAMGTAEGDALFADAAQAEIYLIKTAAAHEKRIAAAKDNAEKELIPLRAGLKELTDKLAAYISAHPERFQNPRARKTAFGRYGLRHVSKLEITDEAKLMDYSDDNSLGLYQLVTKFDKGAIKKAAEAANVPGAEIRSGEETFYSVEKRLLEEA